MSLTLGVLSIQGDVLENIISVKAAIDALGIDGTVTSVRTPDEISKVDGLIIPGGESTTIGQLSVANGSLKILKEKIEQGMPVLGICAGMILLSKTAQDKVVGKIDQPLLDILDIKLERNSFGRQRESFESDKVKEAQKMIDERQSIHGLDVKTLELRMQDRGGSA